MSWTANDLPDLSGKTYLVTGANSGLGFETVKALAKAGGEVTLACRDLGKAGTAIDRIKAEAPTARIEARELDLASLDSIAKFAAAWGDRPLDGLVNNAGVMALPLRRTADGFEMQLGTNHLGHFALTGRMLPRLLAAPGARVVNVSSTMHKFGHMNWDDLQSDKSYGKWRAYGQSKLANLLFTYEFQRRLEAAGADALTAASHPGYAATNLQATGPRMEGSGFLERMAPLVNRLASQTADMGALPSIYAAGALGVKGGDYFGPDGFTGMWGHPKRVPSNKRSHDRGDQLRLWDASEELTGVRFEL
ncbi:MAG: SDR family oxidoreductase [Deltaproteobacteria bacterium]|nr:SDR family oxidoreductase [Deltaproteobacteria bacterium]MBW2444873.1 SDR family oxidoreductase [Deltaproteobacteria bacterium]